MKCTNPLVIVSNLNGTGVKPAIANKVTQAITPPSEDILSFKKFVLSTPYHLSNLANHVDEAGFDQLSIEDAHCCNDLSLLDKFSRKTIIFGSVAIARSRIETVEEVAGRLREALDHIDRERLVVAPDCGLGLLTPEIASKKLDVMVRATKIV